MDFVVRLALLYAGLFGAIGVQLPFLPVWLAAKDLDASAIGLVLALGTATRIVIVPFATRAADRFGSLKTAILVATVVCALSVTALGTATGVAAIVMCWAVANAAGASSLPLTETYALRGLTQRGRAYGPVRLWGSVAFIAATMATGLFNDWIEPIHIIWLLVGVYWLAVIAAMRLLPIDVGAPAERSSADATPLLRSPALLAVIAASSLVQASHALLYGFGTLQWSAAGIGGATIGMLWSIGVLVEIALFAASARFPPTLGPAALLVAGAVAAVVRWSVMALDPSVALLPAVQCLHALSFGATHLGAVQFVARAAPPGLAATAQGWLATANGAVMALAMLLSGLLQARLGSAAYVAMALMAAVGGMAALTIRRRVTD